jgi:hypothetical protein
MRKIILTLGRKKGVLGVAGVHGVQEWKPGGGWFEREPTGGEPLNSVCHDLTRLCSAASASETLCKRGGSLQLGLLRA